MSDKKPQYLEGNINKQLVFKSIPVIFGIMFAISLNLIDTYFVSMLGNAELAAISFTFPIVFFIWGIAMGLSTGASSIISRAIGKGDKSEVVRITTDSLILSLIMTAFFVVVGILSFDWLFSILGATPETVNLIKDYMVVWYPGMIFLVVPVVGNAAIRATGDTKVPSMIMGISVLVNLVLDPIFIFGWGPIPPMGLTGAAIATVIARAVTFIISVHILYKREQMISFSLPKFSEILASWKKIMVIGGPAIGTQLVVPVGIGIITALLANYGEYAVAAFGVASRVESLMLTVFMGLSAVIGPFVGQNWGAGQYDRAREGVKRSYIVSLVWGTFSFIVLALLGETIGKTFVFASDSITHNPELMAKAQEMIHIIKTYLLVVPIGYMFRGVMMVAGTSLNVLNKPFQAAFLTVLYVFVLYIPLSYLGAYFMDIDGIFYAALISGIITGIVAYISMNKQLYSEKNLVVV